MTKAKLKFNVIPANVSDIFLPTQEQGNLRYLPQEDKEIIQLSENILERGLLNLFSVIPADEDVKTLGYKYVIKDGSRRLQAIKLLVKNGKFDGNISVNLVSDETQTETDIDRLLGNITVEKTKAKDIINQILKIKEATGMTNKELAVKMRISEKHLNDLLKTVRLPDVARDALTADEITLTNAIMLSTLTGKVHKDDYAPYLEKAKNQTAKDFSTTVKEFMDAYNEKNQKEREQNKGKFIPRPIMPNKVFLEELLAKAENDAEATPNAITQERLRTMQACFQLDEVSVAKRKAVWEKEQEEQKKAAAERKAKREQDKIREHLAAAEKMGYTITPPKK